MKIIYYGNSDKGMVRSENQDSFGKFPADSNNLNDPLGLLFIVADGMGGHVNGKDASNLAVDVIQKKYFELDNNAIEKKLKDAFQLANSKLFSRNLGDQQLQKMGTTASAILLQNNKGTIAHVGDSRIYRIQQGKIEQLTSDHTIVAEMQKKGILNKEEAKSHPDKSVLNRAIGIEENVEIDILKNIVLKNEIVFVLCSDGLAKVTVEEIKKIVLENSPEVATSILINTANERGGKDNVTVQIIKIEDESIVEPSNVYEAEKAINKKWFKLLTILFLAVSLIIFGVLFFEDLFGDFNSTNNVASEKTKDIKNAHPIELQIDEMNKKAELLFYTSQFDSSAAYYKTILKKHPMHLASLNGLYSIALEFVNNGNKLKKSENYSGALIFYRKAYDLQPQDENITDLINKCELLYNAQVAQTNIETEKSNKLKTLQVATKNRTRKQIDKPKDENINLSENLIWNLEELLKEDFLSTGNDIKFLKNSRSKKTTNQHVVKDFIANVNAMFINSSSNSNAGIIIGYNFNSNTGVEKYFLFTVEPGNRFVLYDVIDGKNSELLSVPYNSETTKDSNSYLLKVKCFGGWIMLYNNEKLLKAFYNDSFIIGKVGLFADANTEVEFKNFNITSALENLKE